MNLKDTHRIKLKHNFYSLLQFKPKNNRIFRIVFLTFFSIGTKSFATEPQHGILNCLKKGCSYSPAFTTTQELRNRIRIEIYNTAEPLYPDYLEVSKSETELNFYSEDKEKMNEMKALVVSLDKGQKFIKNPGGQAEVVIQVHSLESQGVDQLRLGLESLVDRNGVGNNSRFSAGVNSNGNYNFTLNLGNLKTSLFKMAFDYSKTQFKSQKIQSLSVIKRNDEDLGQRSSEQLYRDKENSLTTEKESAQFSVYGKVYISDNNIIRIKNLNINYSQPTENNNSLVKEDYISGGTFDLEPGETRILAIKKVYVKTNSDKTGFLFFRDKQADSSESNLIFTVSANLLSENQDTKQLEAKDKSVEIWHALEGGQKKGFDLIKSIEDILGEIKIYKTTGGFNDIFGQKTSLSLSVSKLDDLNYNRYVRVRILNPNFDNIELENKVVQIFDLATKPLFYSFIKEYENLCPKKPNYCLNNKVIIEISPDLEREFELKKISPKKFIVIDNPGYKEPKIIPFSSDFKFE